MHLFSWVGAALGFRRHSKLGMLPGLRVEPQQPDRVEQQLAELRARACQPPPKRPAGTGFRPSMPPKPPRPVRHPAEPVKPCVQESKRPPSIEMPSPAAYLTTTRTNLIAAFNASQPVRDRDELAGRGKELDKLLDRVVARGSHALIHGPRGSGKTSLARIFADLAGDAGITAMYDSACGDVDFSSLMAPFFSQIPAFSHGRGAEQAAAILGEQFGPRELAKIYSEINGGRLVLIIDEFDRIINHSTKEAVAALIKLLCDMNAPVQLVLVGIATDVDELIAGHPSLGRHLASVPVTPIADSAVLALIDEGSARAGIGFSAEARNLVRSFALGSPYHARLYCLNAGVTALREGDQMIGGHAVKLGMQDAFDDWAAINENAAALIGSLLADGDHALVEAAKVTASIAGRSQYFTAETLNRAMQMNPRLRPEASRMAGASIAALEPILTQGGPGGSYSFADSLAPHFLLLGLSFGHGPFDEASRNDFHQLVPLARAAPLA